MAITQNMKELFYASLYEYGFLRRSESRAANLLALAINVISGLVVFFYMSEGKATVAGRSLMAVILTVVTMAAAASLKKINLKNLAIIFAIGCIASVVLAFVLAAAGMANPPICVYPMYLVCAGAFYWVKGALFGFAKRVFHGVKLMNSWDGRVERVDRTYQFGKNIFGEYGLSSYDTTVREKTPYARTYDLKLFGFFTRFFVALLYGFFVGPFISGAGVLMNALCVFDRAEENVYAESVCE